MTAHHPQRSLSLRAGNGSSCPEPDLHEGIRDRPGGLVSGRWLWSRRVSLRNHEENPVAGESGPTPPQFHRRAGPPIPCDRHVSIRTPEDEDVGAAGAVAATPQNDGASQEGATPKPGAVRGTQWAGPRNAGVQGGTESSNLLCSSGESANSRSQVSSSGSYPTAQIGEGAFVKGTFPLAFGFAGCIAILLATPPLAEIAFTGLAAGMRAAQGLPRLDLLDTLPIRCLQYPSRARGRPEYR
jgi:hypothetical protein